MKKNFVKMEKRDVLLIIICFVGFGMGVLVFLVKVKMLMFVFIEILGIFFFGLKIFIWGDEMKVRIVYII